MRICRKKERKYSKNADKFVSFYAIRRVFRLVIYPIQLRLCHIVLRKNLLKNLLMHFLLWFCNKFESIGISGKRKVENGKRMNCVAIIDIISVADPTFCTLRFALCTQFGKPQFVLCCLPVWSMV